METRSVTKKSHGVASKPVASTHDKAFLARGAEVGAQSNRSEGAAKKPVYGGSAGASGGAKRFCAGCGAARGTGKFCASCGTPL